MSRCESGEDRDVDIIKIFKHLNDDTHRSLIQSKYPYLPAERNRCFHQPFKQHISFGEVMKDMEGQR